MKRIYLYILALGSLILSLLLWGIATQNASIALPHAPIALPQLAAAQAVHIEDDWSGYNDIAPVLAHYDLVSLNDGFRGQGFFSIGGSFPISGQSGKPVTDTEEITIPISSMHNFLNTLQQAHPQGGSYPTPSCCDYYPSLRIELQLPSEEVSFFSTSASGDFILAPPPDAANPWEGLYGHVPWGLILRDKTYIVNSPLPAQALAIINGYLRKDVLDKLAEKLNSR